jgi:hypothetical protein
MDDSKPLKVGFTGTQRGMTPEQRKTLTSLFRVLSFDEFHHGDCVGADAEAFSLVHSFTSSRIVVHPPLNTSKRAFTTHYDESRPERDYLDRNHDIVDETDLLIATPSEPTERLRSGTWATVRYARKSKKDVILVFPNGSLEPSSQ